MKTVEEKATDASCDYGVDDIQHRTMFASGYLQGYNEAIRCQSSPKIKQLEWDFYGTYYTTSRMEYRIETPFIDCKITQGNDFNVYEGGCLLWIDGVSYNFRTLDEAKAVAQADFEKRVMECLDL